MFFQEIFENLSQGILFINSKGIITAVNKSAETLLGIKKCNVLDCRIEEVIPENGIIETLKAGKEKLSKKILLNGKTLILESAPLLENEKVKGVVISLQELSHLNKIAGEFKVTQNLKNQIEKLNNLKKRLEAVFDYCFDEIYVTDGQGVTIFVSKACETLYGVKADDLIGKHVYELEKKGMFSPSITLKVLNKKKKVTLIQTTRKGKKLLVTANPIFDKNGEIDSVVTISRDITEMSILKEKLAETEELSAMYLSEIKKLKKEQSHNQKIIAESKKMKEILEMAKRIAKVDSTVLIEGESGVGKGVVASYIHQCSKRFEKPFIVVNCGAIPENLIESELFGYEPGAFTGAKKSGKKGLFEVAQGGTIFLDEISEIPQSLQVKLLHVIQEKKFRRVGGNKDVNVDIRIIAATNQNLQELVHKGKFREDLFYRLNVVPFWLPPLRHRKEDIVPLIKHFLKKYNDEYRLKKQISNKATEVLHTYNWPGNVRELENLIERLVVTTDSSTIETYHLPDYVLSAEKLNLKGVVVLNVCTLKEATEEMESQLIKKAYEKYRNTYKIAEILQVNQSTVVRKIHKYLGKKYRN